MISDMLFIQFSNHRKNASFMKKRKSKKVVRKISNIQLNASSPPFSNGENRNSLSCSYQKLFKKYSQAFMLPAHMQQKQVLSKFYCYDSS
jgi:hypothetical protein